MQGLSFFWILSAFFLIWGRIHLGSCLVLGVVFWEVLDDCFSLFTSDQPSHIFYFFMIQFWKVV